MILALVGCGAEATNAPAATATNATTAAAGTAGSDLLDPNPAPASINVTIASDNGHVAMDNVFNGFGCTGKNTSLGDLLDGRARGRAELRGHPSRTPTRRRAWASFTGASSTSRRRRRASRPARARACPAGAVQGYTDFGMNGYGGPCPPPGAPHRYIATVYALDVPKLDAGATATGALLRFTAVAAAHGGARQGQRRRSAASRSTVTRGPEL